MGGSGLRLGQARALAATHARAHRHDVRIEPWESFALVELVAAAEFGGPFAGAAGPPQADADAVPHRSRWEYRPGCSCRLCVNDRAARER